MAKMYASDVAKRAAIEGVQIFGGYGYCKECPIPLDSRALPLFLFTVIDLFPYFSQDNQLLKQSPTTRRTSFPLFIPSCIQQITRR